MNDPRLDFAMRIQSIAQAGLSYADNPYDRERYGELRQIAAEMLAAAIDIPVRKIHHLFCNESGYRTPKVDTRAAVFKEGGPARTSCRRKICAGSNCDVFRLL